ncbi:DUF3566 domain-containing protein [Pseudonocardia sp. K10HN5]|uniref:DUF3566 domain-containing protein n=1 Tax=Pseudonocardia acidicola TaxID=2724939 RepID=A0ABX1SHF8_9PSEU|nr:DUF3566 domain-containing protein [Pseudonocardia acidicola]
MSKPSAVTSRTGEASPPAADATGPGAAPAPEAAPAAPRPGGTPSSEAAAAAEAAPAASAQVPTPGPAATPPPPWRRVPGDDAPPPGPAAEPAGPPRVAGGLLDAPTAYIERPAGEQGPQARGPVPGGEPEATRGGERGWSAVRAVRNRPPRQAALQLKRLDPWSVLKLALVLAVVLFFIWLVAVGVLYGVLDGMGVWDRLNGTYNDLVSGETQSGGALISAGRVFGLAAVVGAINSLLFAVAVTVAAFVYNVSADLVGGIEVTLSERD